MKKYYILLNLLLFTFYVSAQTIILEEIGPSFSKPVSIKNAGDDRLFIVEQNGYIRILKTNGTTPATPFLDITSKVETSGSFEKGFLGLAFHPNYSSNGYFYVHYTGADTVTSDPSLGFDTPGADGQVDSYIVRYTVSGNPDIANAGSELVIMTISHPYDAHYGGDLNFGSDGYLYIAKGDGGNSAGDPENRSQSLNQPHGKILRIDVDATPTNNTYGNNYSIPPSNPYSSSPDGASDPRQEVWSYGLRNPAKFSFDSDGNMWIADTGQETNEEVNLNVGNASSKNFGWRCYEGSDEFDTSAGCPNINTITFAVNEYTHGGSPFRCAVIGGYRYRGTAQPNLAGIYFFGDWCSSKIFMLTESGGSWSRTEFIPSGNKNWTGFGEGNDKELYVIGNYNDGGKVHRIKQEGGLSTNTIDAKTNFSIVPNPTSNNIVSLTFLNKIELKEINTYNLHGQKVKSNVSTLNSNTVNLELNGLASGIYIIEAISITGEKSQNKLVIK